MKKRKKSTFSRWVGIIIVLLTLAVCMQSVYIYQLRKVDNQLSAQIVATQTELENRTGVLAGIVVKQDDALKVLVEDYNKRHKTF